MKQVIMKLRNWLGKLTHWFPFVASIALTAQTAQLPERFDAVAADLCTEIDIPAKRMVVALPEGLDDLDAVAD